MLILNWLIVCKTALKVLSDRAKSLLSEWLITEQRRVSLSDRAFAQRLGVSYGTIQAWRERRVDKLTKESVEMLARYRGETLEQVDAWLDGLEVGAEPLLISAIKTASINDLIQGMRAIANRLESLLGVPMNQNSVAIIIRGEFAAKGLDPARREDFLQFFRCGPFDAEEEAAIYDIVQGRQSPDSDLICDLAIALENFSGKPYSASDLEKLNQARHHQQQR